MQEKADFDLDNKLPLNSPVKITYKNVSFKYREQEEKYALKDLSFEIEHGNFIGIVGRNGSGKTTLVKLLSKLYENYKGEITLNDGELRNILPSQIREKISVVPQEVFLFNGTIKENIQYGNPKASTEEIIEAAKAADLHAFVESLYLGYNTMVGDSGSNMSGGQRLKIALARLLVSNPEIIILDEASSSLDVETEKKVMESIKSKFRGKTIISIAHRINTLQTADKILVLDDGKLIEQGNHKELMDLNGLYKKFIDTYITY
jgi:ABC-type multidrug transport system fused ATPase/permease subunit